MLISAGASYVAVTLPFTLLVLYMLQMYYLRTSRQLRFMDLEAKSPLFTHFLQTFQGLHTIRAFGWQHEFIETNLKHLDRSQRPYYLLYCIQRWLNLVLDLVVAALAVIVVTFATQLPSSSSGGDVGIALNNVLGFNQTLTLIITSWTTLETSLGAIARVKSFEEQTPKEHIPSEVPPLGEHWPENGMVEFRNVTASYGYSLPTIPSKFY